MYFGLSKRGNQNAFTYSRWWRYLRKFSVALFIFYSINKIFGQLFCLYTRVYGIKSIIFFLFFWVIYYHNKNLVCMVFDWMWNGAFDENVINIVPLFFFFVDVWIWVFGCCCYFLAGFLLCIFFVFVRVFW